MAKRDDDERRDRNERAAASAIGAGLGAVWAGPPGAALGAGLGPLLEPLVKGVWAELSESARQRQTDVLFWAIRDGIPVDEMAERISASEQTKLLTGFALSAATRTAWEDKLRTLGRSLAEGLLAEDGAKIDTEQMIIAAITDIEGPQLALLEFLVCWEPGPYADNPPIDGPLHIPKYAHGGTDGRWRTGERAWTIREIAYARPNLAPITPSLLGTLQRHGLAVQNDNTGEAFEWYSTEFEKKLEEQYARERSTGAFGLTSVPTVRNLLAGLIPKPTWSPTELGEQVFIRFRDAGTDLPDVWASGPADQQE